MKSTFKQWTLIALTIATILVACKKDDDEPQPNPKPNPEQQYDALALSTQTATTITLVKGATQTITITAGSGDYSVVSENPAIAETTLSNTVVSVKAKAEGDVKILIKDNKSNQSKELTFSVIINPTIKWSKVIGGSDSEGDDVIAVIKTNDGGFAMLVQTFSTDGDFENIPEDLQYATNFHIMKFDANHNLMWSKVYGSSQNDDASSLIQTSDGGYLVVGRSTLHKANDGDVKGHHSTGPRIESDIWVIKLKPNGDLEWQRPYGGQRGDVGIDVIAVADGYLILASVDSFDGDFQNVPGYESKQYIDPVPTIMKIGFNGEIKQIIPFKNGPSFRKIKATPDGGYIILGSASYNSKLENLHGSSDIYIMKLDKDFKKQWGSCYGSDKMDSANNILLTSDGGYVVAGQTWANQDNGDVKGVHGGVEGWAFKINSSGKLQWQRTVGGEEDDRIYDIQSTTDGQFLCAIGTYSANGDFTQNKGRRDAAVMKIDSNGNIKWQKSFGGSRDDEFTQVLPSDTGYILFGRSASADGDVKENKGSDDIWIVFIQ